MFKTTRLILVETRNARRINELERSHQTLHDHYRNLLFESRDNREKLIQEEIARGWDSLQLSLRLDSVGVSPTGRTFGIVN